MEEKRWDHEKHEIHEKEDRERPSIGRPGESAYPLSKDSGPKTVL